MYVIIVNKTGNKMNAHVKTILTLISVFVVILILMIAINKARESKDNTLKIEIGKLIENTAYKACAIGREAVYEEAVNNGHGEYVIESGKKIFKWKDIK